MTSTGQHTDLLKDALIDLGLQIDRISPPIPKQRDLAMLLSAVINNVGAALRDDPADLVIVLGDRTSALGAGLAAFNLRVPVCHIEAGLRSGSSDDPFPEETNRRLLSRLASYHFPTSEAARDNLLREGIDPDSTFLVKNPACDPLEWALAANKVTTRPKRPTVLVTIHRREHRREKIAVLRDLIDSRALPPDLMFTLAWHPSLQENRDALSEMENRDNFSIIPHETYFSFVARMAQAALVITDSGGVSEEATQLRRPLVIFRNMTEREHLIPVGVNSIVTLNENEIIQAIKAALELNPKANQPNLGDLHSRVGNQIGAAIVTKILPTLIARTERHE